MLHSKIAYLQMAEWQLLLIFSERADKIHATLLAIYVGNKNLSLQHRWLTVHVKYYNYIFHLFLIFAGSGWTRKETTVWWKTTQSNSCIFLASDAQILFALMPRRVLILFVLSIR
jgi:hypothetical protein